MTLLMSIILNNISILFYNKSCYSRSCRYCITLNRISPTMWTAELLHLRYII